MKKLIEVSLKSIIFFIGWAICASVIPIPDIDNAALWRFFAELIPFLAIVVMSVIFWFVDRKKTKLHLTQRPVYSSVLGGTVGLSWLGISMLWLWILSAFINTIMQEMLVRGYLYQMIKRNYNVVAATVVSTILFTFAHGGAFEAGTLPVLNVLTMSLFMTAVLEYTNSLIAPIIVHFLWNSVGAIILGGVSLAEDYPHLFNMTFGGNQLLSGGIYKIEGSVVVFVLNVIMIIGFIMAKKKKNIA